MSLKLLVLGDLLNLVRACLCRLIASLQSSLYHCLLLVGFVEVYRNIYFRYLISKELKSDKESKD